MIKQNESIKKSVDCYPVSVSVLTLQDKYDWEKSSIAKSTKYLNSLIVQAIEFVSRSGKTIHPYVSELFPCVDMQCGG